METNFEPKTTADGLSEKIAKKVVAIFEDRFPHLVEKKRRMTQSKRGMLEIISKIHELSANDSRTLPQELYYQLFRCEGIFSEFFDDIMLRAQLMTLSTHVAMFNGDNIAEQYIHLFSAYLSLYVGLSLYEEQSKQLEHTQIFQQESIILTSFTTFVSKLRDYIGINKCLDQKQENTVEYDDEAVRHTEIICLARELVYRVITINLEVISDPIKLQGFIHSFTGFFASMDKWRSAMVAIMTQGLKASERKRQLETNISLFQILPIVVQLFICTQNFQSMEKQFNNFLKLPGQADAQE